MTTPVLSRHQIDAMDAIFAFSKAMSDGNLSTLDLREVMRQAIADGHEMLAVQIIMATEALRPLAPGFFLPKQQES